MDTIRGLPSIFGKTAYPSLLYPGLADHHRKRSEACSGIDPTIPFTGKDSGWVRYRFYNDLTPTIHTDPKCDGDTVLERYEPFRTCLSVDGGTFFQYEHKILTYAPVSGPNVTVDVIQQCFYTQGAGTGDSCCVDTNARQCDNPLRNVTFVQLNQCQEIAYDIISSTKTHTDGIVDLVLPNNLSTIIWANNTTGRKKLVVTQFLKPDCTGETYANFTLTGCNAGTAALYGVETTKMIHVQFLQSFYRKNMLNGNAMDAKYCAYQQENCNTQMGNTWVPPIFCQVYTNISNSGDQKDRVCETDGTNSHVIYLFDDSGAFDSRYSAFSALFLSIAAFCLML